MTRKTTFMKNITVMMSGTVIAQLLNILSAPFLTRVYVPEDFGMLAYYTSILSVLSVIMTLRYETAIVLPKTEAEAANIFVLSGIITLIVSVGIFLSIPFVGVWLATLLGAPKLVNWLWLIPLSALLVGLNNTFEFWATRNKSFKDISTAKVFRGIGVTSVQVGGGIGKLGVSGLIAGQLVGQFVSVVFLMKSIYRTKVQMIVRVFQWKSVVSLAKKYKDFPLFSCSQSLVNAFSQNAAPFILGAIYGSGVVGFYALALKLISLPASIISESVRQVYFQSVSTLYNEGKCLSRSLQKMTGYLAAIAFVPAIILIVSSPMLFQFILGANWYEAGEYSRWLVIWLFFSFINQPSIAVIQVYLIQRVLLIYEVVLFISRVLIMIVVAMKYSAIASIAAFSIVGALFNAILVLSVIMITLKRDRSLPN